MKTCNSDFASDVEIPHTSLISLWRCHYSPNASEGTPRDATFGQKESDFEIFECKFNQSDFEIYEENFNHQPRVKPPFQE
jgi:hypothetical protein